MCDKYILVHSHISFTFKSNDVINLISFEKYYSNPGEL